MLIRLSPCFKGALSVVQYGPHDILLHLVPPPCRSDLAEEQYEMQR